jgi:hypothetical protein
MTQKKKPQTATSVSAGRAGSAGSAAKKRPWKEEEDNKIKELHKTNTYEQIGVIIGRQKGSVFTRMKHLGLSRPVEQPSRIGIISHPAPGVTVHIGKYGNSMK